MICSFSVNQRHTHPHTHHRPYSHRCGLTHTQKRREEKKRKKNLFLDKEGKILFDSAYSVQKKRIFNALKNSNADSVIKFKEVLKRIIDGK